MFRGGIVLADQTLGNESQPLVSAVIPTRNRPQLVVRAVRTALDQSFRDLEVVVVIDGPDPETTAALQRIADPRLRIVALPKNVGASDARNAGVQAARGHWIAFLDDDDEWLPAKIEKQVAKASASRFAYPIVSSRLIARTSCSEMIWPRKMPTDPISEYLFTRSSWAFGEGCIPTITIFTSRALLTDVPFRTGLRKHQELDWLLRVVGHAGVGIEFVPEPLAVYNIHEGVQSVSRTADWSFSLEWIRDRRELVTPRAYAGFILSQCANQAATQRAWRSFIPLLTESCRFGSPTVFDFALYTKSWIVEPLVQVKWLRRAWRAVRGKPPL
jgi:glycosyltransferase involved in cell wall biosynthesis